MRKSEFAHDIEAVISDLSARQNLSREEIIENSLREWMHLQGLLTERSGDKNSEKASAGKPDPEYVQYPGYFEGKGSL